MPSHEYWMSYEFSVKNNQEALILDINIAHETVFTFL